MTVAVISCPCPASETEKEVNSVGVGHIGEHGIHTMEWLDEFGPTLPIALPIVVIRTHDPSVDGFPRSSEKIRKLSLSLKRKTRHELFCRSFKLFPVVVFSMSLSSQVVVVSPTRRFMFSGVVRRTARFANGETARSKLKSLPLVPDRFLEVSVGCVIGTPFPFLSERFLELSVGRCRYRHSLSKVALIGAALLPVPAVVPAPRRVSTPPLALFVECLARDKYIGQDICRQKSDLIPLIRPCACCTSTRPRRLYGLFDLQAVKAAAGSTRVAAFL
jgi:hypothetical protein